jgi:hypothetical protein
MTDATYTPVDNTKYFVRPNPGHFWIQDNVPGIYGNFIIAAVQYNRYVNIGRWTLAFMGKKLDAIVKADNLDHDTAYGLWESYCEFKYDLESWRLAKAAG